MPSVVVQAYVPSELYHTEVPLWRLQKEGSQGLQARSGRALVQHMHWTHCRPPLAGNQQQ